MLDRKLDLDRDFTRFLNDPTFPYKVTVCIGEERILCSGVILAQQSSLLEQKFREDNSVLMFEEMLDVDGGSEGLNKCIRFLHGADVDLNIEDFAVCVKFASLYQVNDLFEYCLQWLKERFKIFDCGSSVKEALSFLKLSHGLNMNDSERLQSEIRSFIRSFSSDFSLQIVDLIDEDVIGIDIITILNENLEHNSEILKKWALLSIDNRNFIIRNHDRFNLAKVFPNKEFSSFMSLLSEGTANSTESCKALLNIQEKFFTFQLTKSLAPSANCANSADPDNGASNETINDNQLYIGNLPYNVDENELSQLFSGFGKITNTSLKRECGNCSCYASMTFENAHSVDKVLQSSLNGNFCYRGNILKIEKSFVHSMVRSQPGMQSAQGNQRPQSSMQNKQQQSMAHGARQQERYGFYSPWLCSPIMLPMPELIINQQPLSSQILNHVNPQEQKQMLGEKLYPIIQASQPELAGKITGMLLEMENSEILHMLEEDNTSLNSKVNEAVAVLKKHQQKLAMQKTTK